MYAIVRTGGKQYRVERGQKLLVERLEAAEGADVKLEPLLFRSDDAVFDKDGLAGVQVTAKVLGHVRGEKLRVFKFKPKRGYKRRTGHRQELTQIEVLDISHGAKARKAPAKAKAETEAKEQAQAEAAPKAAAKAPAPKAPDAKAPAAVKAPAKAKAKAEPEGKAAVGEKAPAKAKAKADTKAKAAPKAKAAAKPKAKDAKGDVKAPAKEDDQDGS